MAVLTGNPKEDLEIIKEAAKVVYPTNLSMRALCICQAILESGILQGGSTLSNKYNNLFGIKGRGIVTNKFINLDTKEYFPHKGWIIIRAIRQDYTPGVSFAWNASVEESFMQHKRLMEKPGYKHLFNSKTPQDAMIGVKQAGYATDPAYPLKLIDIYNTYIKEK